MPGRANMKENQLTNQAAKNAISYPLAIIAHFITKQELISSIKMARLLEFSGYKTTQSQTLRNTLLTAHRFT